MPTCCFSWLCDELPALCPYPVTNYGNGMWARHEQWSQELEKNIKAHLVKSLSTISVSVWAEPGPCVFQHIISPTRWQSTECEVGLRVGANWPQLCNLHIKLIREFIWVQVEQETLTSSLPSNKSLFPRPFEPHFEQPCLPSRRTRWQKIVLTKASDTIFWHNREKKNYL